MQAVVLNSIGQRLFGIGLGVLLQRRDQRCADAEEPFAAILRDDGLNPEVLLERFEPGIENRQFGRRQL